MDGTAENLLAKIQNSYKRTVKMYNIVGWNKKNIKERIHFHGIYHHLIVQGMKLVLDCKNA